MDTLSADTREIARQTCGCFKRSLNLTGDAFKINDTIDSAVISFPRARANFARPPRGRPIPEEFPPYKLQIQSAPRYIERTPNVAPDPGKILDLRT